MSRFNQKPNAVQAVLNDPKVTQNHEGGVAFSSEKKEELYLLAVTTLLKDKFYEKAPEQLTRLKELVKEAGKEFTLKLAVYCRNVLNLRTISTVLLAEAIKLKDENVCVRSYIPQILRRADEPQELLAYFWNQRGDRRRSEDKLPIGAKRGIGDALNNFSAYQFAKYNRPKLVTMKDVIKIVHPKPVDQEHAEIFSDILKDDLDTPDTWEVLISTQGSTKENWEAIAPKMGELALLRNLRNFEQKGADKAISIACERFNNKEKVLRSKIFPFQWLTAYNNVTHPRLKDAILAAMNHSVELIPKFNGKLAIFVDLSGSMSSPCSNQLTCREVAALMGAMAARISDDYVVGAFASLFEWVETSKHDSVVTNFKKIMDRSSYVGSSTFGHLCTNALVERKYSADRVIIFTDMQLYNESHTADSQFVKSWMNFKSKQNEHAQLVCFDLTGYGHLLLPSKTKNVITIGGFSNKAFEMIECIFDKDKAIGFIEGLDVSKMKPRHIEIDDAEANEVVS